MTTICDPKITEAYLGSFGSVAAYTCFLTKKFSKNQDLCEQGIQYLALGHARSRKRHKLKADIFTLWSGTLTHQTHVDQEFVLGIVNVTVTVKPSMSSLNLLESYLNVIIVGEVTKAVAEEVDETLDTGHQPALWPSARRDIPQRHRKKLR